jgi:hypothetical protein
MTSTAALPVSCLDWNAAKALARKVARKHGIALSTRGESYSRKLAHIRKGDAIQDGTRAFFWCDFDSNDADRVDAAFDDMRAQGLVVVWDGNVLNSARLYVNL